MGNAFCTQSSGNLAKLSSSRPAALQRGFPTRRSPCATLYGRCKGRSPPRAQVPGELAVIRLGSEVAPTKNLYMAPGIYSLLVRYLISQPTWYLILLNLALHVSSSAGMCNTETRLMASMGPMSCVINYSRNTRAVHWTRLADSREKACCLEFCRTARPRTLLCQFPRYVQLAPLRHRYQG